MTAGIPDEMRRTALVSLAAHVAVLALLSSVPLVKAPPMGTAAIQVMLVSKGTSPAPPAQVEPRPEPKPVVKAAPPPVPKPVEPPAPVVERPVERLVPQAIPPPAKERQAEALQQRIKEVAVPKLVEPVQKAPVAARAEPPRLLPAEPPVKREVPVPPVVKQEPVAPKGDTPQDIKEILRRADEALRKSPNAAAGKPAARSADVPSRPRTTDEISKLLGQLPPPIVTPDGKKTASRPDQPRASLAEQVKTMLAQASPPSAPESPAQKKPPAVPAVQVSKGPSAAPRTAALERCPPKARAYCPLLEAAINRVWNADTDPGVRSVLESAGDSTAIIRMVILPDGVIKDIQLSKSSGNEAYDRAVQSVLRELRRLPPLPAEMKGEPFVAVTSFTYSRKRDS